MNTPTLFRRRLAMLLVALCGLALTINVQAQQDNLRKAVKKTRGAGVKVSEPTFVE